MCNHYQNHPEAIPTWKEYIGAADDTPFSEIKIDVWPKYQGIVARVDDRQKKLDTMQWGVPLTMKGKRPGHDSHKTNNQRPQSLQLILALDADKA